MSLQARTRPSFQAELDLRTAVGTQVCLDDALCHLLPWDIERIIDDPVDDPEEEPEV